MDPRWFETFPPSPVVLGPCGTGGPVGVLVKPIEGKVEQIAEFGLYEIVKLRQIVAAQAAELKFCREELAKRDAELARWRPKMPANALLHSI